VCPSTTPLKSIIRDMHHYEASYRGGGGGGRQTIESIEPLQKFITSLCKMKSELIMEIGACNHFTSWERGVVHISYLPNRRSLSDEFNTADCSNSLM
jgi:hypothetical protein